MSTEDTAFDDYTPAWSDANQRALTRLLSEHQGTGALAVFDWDNTSVFLDVQEATAAYQLTHLRLAIPPHEIGEIIRQGVPPDPFLPQFNNAAGQPVTIEACAHDIVDSYARLYQRGLADRQGVDHQNFITKVRYLYDAIDATFHPPISHPWITYFFAGMTPTDVRKLAFEAVSHELQTPIGQETWTSPDELPGQAGVVSIALRRGLRLLPEMQQLYAALRAHGFEVWVCSASLGEIIDEIATRPEFGYDQPSGRVLGLQLETDDRGRYLPRTRSHITWGPGKVAAIRELAREPVFLAGDSEGDADMLRSFGQIVLIINRQQAALAEFLEDPRCLWQERDEQRGQFIDKPRPY